MKYLKLIKIYAQLYIWRRRYKKKNPDFLSLLDYLQLLRDGERLRGKVFRNVLIHRFKTSEREDWLIRKIKKVGGDVRYEIVRHTYQVKQVGRNKGDRVWVQETLEFDELYDVGKTLELT